MKMKLPTIEQGVKIQNTIIEDYFIPHVDTILRASFAFIFFFYGLQKIAPGETPVDVPIGYIIARTPFIIETTTVVTLIGIYEIILGLIFLFNEIRIAAILFFPHQITTQLVILLNTKVFFTPPYLEIGPIEIPWLMGSFAAFALKNVVFIAGFIALLSWKYNNNKL